MLTNSKIQHVFNQNILAYIIDTPAPESKTYVKSRDSYKMNKNVKKGYLKWVKIVSFFTSYI